MTNILLIIPMSAKDQTAEDVVKDYYHLTHTYIAVGDLDIRNGILSLAWYLK